MQVKELTVISFREQISNSASRKDSMNK